MQIAKTLRIPIKALTIIIKIINNINYKKGLLIFEKMDK